ncbi:MAG: efflux RND transporter periplasmic adaptor subunit [Moraxellaceae bacterium]|nr:efflux RND transporter periplasmic adaptor subunit [Moraxellaceae bacterium]
MNKKIIATLLLGTVLGSVASYYIQQRPTNVTLITPLSAQLQSTILATGQVKTRTSTLLNSETAGLVTELAEEGQFLKKANNAAYILDKDAQSLSQQAQANLESSQIKLQHLRTIEREQAKLKLEQATILVKQAERQLANIKALAEQQLASIETLTTAQETLALRQKELANARLQQQSLQANGLEEQAAISQQQMAQAQANQAQIRSQKQHIVSPFDAVVLERKASIGQYVKQGDALLSIAPPQQKELIANVDERWLPQLSLNQQATVLADAFPQQKFTAHINYIAPAVSDSRGTIEIRLGNSQWPDFLQEGMTVSIELVTTATQQSIVIPTHLLQQSDNQYWVWIAKNDTAQRQNIGVGLRHLDKIQVLDGLDSTSQLIDSKTPLQLNQKVNLQKD